jgi:hypothetical protein
MTPTIAAVEPITRATLSYRSRSAPSLDVPAQYRAWWHASMAALGVRPMSH